MVEMTKMFETKMAEFQMELQQAVASRKNPNSIAALNTDFNTFKSFVCNGLSVLRSELDSLRNRVERIEMSFRRKMLLVHGIPEQKNEDTCAAVVTSLASACKGHNLDTSCISASYRLGKQGNSKPRPIVVKFADVSVRACLWKNKVALKGSKITLSEFLTKSRHELFMAAREKFGIPNCWTMDGVINIKTPDGKRHKVESLADFRIISTSTTA